MKIIDDSLLTQVGRGGQEVTETEDELQLPPEPR